MFFPRFRLTVTRDIMIVPVSANIVVVEALAPILVGLRRSLAVDLSM
jgi:hypothetical protein